MGAMPMGEPGWPEFARWTASMTKVRMVLMQSWSMSCCAWIIPSPLRRQVPNAMRAGDDHLCRQLDAPPLARCWASREEQYAGMAGGHEILVGGHDTHHA